MMAKPQCIPIKEMMGWYSFLANHGGDFSLYQDDYQDGHEDGRWYSRLLSGFLTPECLFMHV